jgi:hypothetical protein
MHMLEPTTYAALIKTQRVLNAARRQCATAPFLDPEVQNARVLNHETGTPMGAERNFLATRFTSVFRNVLNSKWNPSRNSHLLSPPQADDVQTPAAGQQESHSQSIDHSAFNTRPPLNPAAVRRMEETRHLRRGRPALLPELSAVRHYNPSSPNLPRADTYLIEEC